MKPVSKEALVLGVLREGPQHGYSIARQINERSASVLSLGEGQLYPLLKRLEKDGLIEGEWETSEEGRPPRRVYALSAEGRAELERQAERWRQVSLSITQILGQPEGGSA